MLTADGEHVRVGERPHTYAGCCSEFDSLRKDDSAAGMHAISANVALSNLEFRQAG